MGIHHSWDGPGVSAYRALTCTAEPSFQSAVKPQQQAPNEAREAFGRVRELMLRRFSGRSVTVGPRSHSAELCALTTQSIGISLCRRGGLCRMHPLRLARAMGFAQPRIWTAGSRTRAKPQAPLCRAGVYPSKICRAPEVPFPKMSRRPSGELVVSGKWGEIVRFLPILVRNCGTYEKLSKPAIFGGCSGLGCFGSGSGETLGR